MEIEFSFCLNRTLVGIHVRQWWGMKLKRGRGADDVIWPCADLHWVHMVTQRTQCSASGTRRNPLECQPQHRCSARPEIRYSQCVSFLVCLLRRRAKASTKKNPVWTDIPAANVCFFTMFLNKQAYFYFSSCVNRITMKKHTGFDDCIYLNNLAI